MENPSAGAVGLSKQQGTYFASLPQEEIGQALWERKRVYEKFIRDNGLLWLYKHMHYRYYGKEEFSRLSDNQIGQSGDAGEMSILKMNHLRSITTSWVNLASAQRATMAPIAVDGDYESELQVKRGKAVLDFFRTVGGHEALERDQVEMAAIYGAAFRTQCWNEALGEVSQVLDPNIIPDAGSPQPSDDATPPTQAKPAVARAGDLESFVTSPMDTFFDPYRKDTKLPWVIIRTYRSKWAIAARFPQFRDKILACTPETDADGIDFGLFNQDNPAHRNPDEICLYYFFHEKDEALAAGRFALFIKADLVLKVDKLGYREIPVRAVRPASIKRSAIGYSPAWGLLAPQEAIDRLSTIGLTNASTFGLGTIIAPKNADVDVAQIAEGLNLVEYAPGLNMEPKPLQMPTTPQEVYVSRDSYINEMGTLIGVNSVIRGDPEASLKSGSALVLVQAQGVQFSSDFQAEITSAQEAAGMDCITICQDYMSEEREFALVGEHTASLLKAFSGKDMNKLVRIRVQKVNPLSKTIAGRVQMADTLMERFSKVLQPGDYFRVLETGELSHLTDPQQQKSANMDRENQMLAEGIGAVPLGPQVGPDGMPMVGPDGQPQMVPQKEPGKRYIRALLTDNHREHVARHLEVIDNPAVRDMDTPEAQAVVNAVISHINEHEQLLTTLTLKRQGLLELTNQMPLQAAIPPPPPPMLGGGGPPGLPPGAPHPPGAPPQLVNKAPGGPQPSPAQSMQPTPAGGGKLPLSPQMPKNPQTNSRALPPGPP